MEWIAEGLTLCFIGLLVFAALLTAGSASQTVILVGRSCAVMLMVMAVLSAFTGARTTILPMRLCPFIKTLVAVFFLIATY